MLEIQTGNGSEKVSMRYNVFVIKAKRKWWNIFIKVKIYIMFSEEENPKLPKGYSISKKIGEGR